MLFHALIGSPPIWGCCPLPWRFSVANAICTVDPWMVHVSSQIGFTGHHSPVANISMVGFVRPRARGGEIRIAHVRVHHTVNVQRR
jgi:hypothetical protein